MTNNEGNDDNRNDDNMMNVVFGEKSQMVMINMIKMTTAMTKMMIANKTGLKTMKW